MPLRLTLRLLPVAALTWGVALVATHLPSTARVLAVVLWATALALITVLAAHGISRPRWRAPAAAVVVVVALAGPAAAASHVALALPHREAAMALDLVGGRDVVVHAQVVGKVERRSDGALAFDAVATRVDVGTTRHALRVEVAVRVLPAAVDDRAAMDVGAEIEARGVMAEGRPGERAVFEIRAGRGVSVTQRATGPAAVTSLLRQRLVAAATALPGPAAGLVPGLAVGDTSAVTSELDLAMKESSLSHLTAVSGANCALVVGLAFAAAAALGASRALRVVVGLGALLGFVVLVTPEPSVARAAAMAAIAMLGVLLGRPGAGMAILSLAVSVLLIGDPWLAGSLGFALSAAATGSLLMFTRPLARGLGRVMPHSLALALAVPLSAQLACGPLLVLIAPEVSVYGVLANLLAAPAAPVATIVGLAACLAAPIPLIQGGLAHLAWLPATWIASTATTISGLPGDLVPWPEGLPGAAALAAVGLAVGLVIALRGGSPRRRAIRVVSAVVVCVVVGSVAGSGLLSTAAGRLTLPAAWTILACDVGQGDAVLLRSGDAVALIDTGPEPEPLAACLDRAGVHRIDLLVLTHFDLDHIGGLSAVEGRVGLAMHGPTETEDAPVLDRLAASGARIVEARRGLSGVLGGARWQVLWPAPDARAFPAGNDASVVLDVRGGGIPPTLLLGDLSAAPQQSLVASGALRPPYAVVKVAHHGSADQDAGLYRRAAPSVGLVSVGASNRFGHPREEILEVLGTAGASIARTDRDGVVAAWATPEGVSVWRERGG